MRAVCLIRPQPDYRRDAFIAGLQRTGYRVDTAMQALGPGDVLLIWNRYGIADRHAQRAEAAGATVLVAENGYLGREWNGGRWYALSRSRHNGAGSWPEGGGERWNIRGINPAPFRKDGRHLLLLPQRGIGTPPAAMPPDWLQRVQRELRMDRPVRIRKHPGEGRPEVPLEEDLRDAWACLTWGSGAALKALVVGVPVFHSFPQWIGAPAARQWPADVEQPFLGDRLPMLRRMAWAMWELEEIARGEPFRHLLPTARQGQGPARL